MSRGFHHLLERRRAGAMRAYDSLMLAVGVGAPLTLLPQIVQLFEYKNASELSPWTWGLLGTINFLWSIYGLVHRERPILIANFLMATLDFVIVLEIFLYR